MRTLETVPPVVLATTGPISTTTYFSEESLKVGDLVELTPNGKSVKRLDQGAYRGIVLSREAEDVGGKKSCYVCILSEGRVEMALTGDLLKKKALTVLAPTVKGFKEAQAGDFSCAYLLNTDTNWSGTAMVEFFFPPLFIAQGRDSKAGK